MIIPGASADDEEAEDVVLGASSNSFAAARRASSIVSAADFYRPGHGRAFEAALAIADEQDGLTTAERVTAGWGRERRIDEVAARAGVSRMLVAQLAESSPVMFDIERYARRVANASARRRLMGACSAAFNALGEGQSLREVVPILAAALHDVFGEYVRSSVLPAVQAARRAA